MNRPSFTQKCSAFLKDPRRWLPAALLLAILLLGGFLRFYQLGQAGAGNPYYAAAVKSMLTSWRNFFFVAFEPGGSISVDKPPLGFWVQAVSAYFLGLNGFALALPNALAGVLSIFVLYKLVQRPFGTWAGLLAALALALMPAAVSTERNNTIDGLLVFVLLLAAAACLEAVYRGQRRWLFLGAMLVGLGFNIKMLQAFLPLPAFYAVYFFAARQRWWQKALNLALASVLLAAVALSWAVVVDLTPASARPYVDSTTGNSVMELIFGHNGIERLANLHLGQVASTGQAAASAADGAYQAAQGPYPGGRLPQPPAGGPPPGGGPGGPGGSMDFGTAGTLRLFTQPLADEASWLLPFALGGLLVVGLALWKRPFGDQHAALILWAGWLLPEALYFTYSQGLMHAYYLIMLGAPLAALAALAAWGLWQLIRRRARLGWALAALLAGATLAFQGFTLWSGTSAAPWALAGAGLLFAAGLTLAALGSRRSSLRPLALGLVALSLLVAPGLWSGLTAFNTSPNSALPSAGPAQHSAMAPGMPGGGPGGMPPVTQSGTPPGAAGETAGSGQAPQLAASNPPPGGPGSQDQELLNYLLANTTPGSYLLATTRANDAAPYILATGRPVLTFGGFLDEYQEVTVDQLAGLVQSGRLRYVLNPTGGRHAAISQWVQQNCSLVDSSAYSSAGAQASNGPGGAGGSSLYDCGTGSHGQNS